MQPLSGNQRPDLLTPLMNMSLVLRLPREMHLCRSSANVPRLPSFLEMLSNPMFCSLLTRCRIPCACHAKPHLNLQKWSEHVVLLTFWLGHVLCATTACTFFDIATSKSAPNVRCFVHFDFEMCFAPERRALFRHLNFQKWSDAGVLCTFWLRNVLRAPSRHNCVHFFDISTSQSGPNMRCFVHFDFHMCFAPQRRATFHLSSGQNAPHPPQAYFSTLRSHKSLEKHSVSRLSYLFAHLHLLSSESFSSLIFSLRLFSSLTLPTSAFPSVRIVGSLTSKLPSKIVHFKND